MYENVKKVEQEGALGAGVGFIKGVLVAAIFTAVVFFVFALLLSYTPMGEEAIPYIALITEGAGAGIAGFCSAKRATLEPAAIETILNFSGYLSTTLRSCLPIEPVLPSSAILIIIILYP